MAAFSSTLSQMLQSITTAKIEELANQQGSLESKRSSILSQLKTEPDLRGRIRILLDGLKSFEKSTSSHESGLDDEITDDESSSDDESDDSDNSDETSLEDFNSDALGISPQNIRQFLDQSKFDPSISSGLLEEWEKRLTQRLNTHSLKYQYATLFGKLITEWVSTQGKGEVQPCIPDVPSAAENSPMQESFEQVGRKEMHEQRQEFESYVFSPEETDVTAIKAYLSKLFKADKDSEKALQRLRESNKRFDVDLKSNARNFSPDVLRWCIKGLEKSDVLSDEKRFVLDDLARNDVVLEEVSDVLNMRFKSLDGWSWGSEGIPLDIRRQLNGRYRVFMDEDVLQALFIQFIGTKWAVQLKTSFTAFFDSRAWKPSSKPIPKVARIRRDYFIDELAERPDGNIETERTKTFKNDYFMTQLPSSVDEGGRGYDEESDYAETTKSPVQIKQNLLHILCTESLIQRYLHGEFTVVRSDFKWFGPSLPHTSTFAVLEFLGVPGQWISFFRRFLEAPIKFIQDGPDASTRVRKRGVPMGHTLSTVFGEAILFCMDFAVNRETDGSLLYRLHDDIWFWGQEEKCVVAWRTMTKFAQLMGISFNEEKTGTIRIVKKGLKEQRPLAKSLPTTGDIRWGFLRLDSASGRFLIDPEQVDKHIEEIKRQLSACNSVLAFVQAWNSYVDKFLITNFGQTANSFGEAHVDMVIETLQRIQRGLFADNAGKTSDGGVIQHLKTMLQNRFGVTNVPDGFFYFPVELGGLDLRNPFIGLFALKGKVHKDPGQRIRNCFKSERTVYARLKEKFDQGSPPRQNVNVDIEDRDVFMSFEEYTRYREQTSGMFLSAYQDLCMVPTEGDVESTAEAITALKQLQWAGDRNKSGFNSNWSHMKPYWKWILQLYGPVMIQTFGGLTIVEKGLLPMGMVNMLRGGKVRWQG
ncbi:MAG: hypothetical protein M4579_003341 [Chaenotheca gracillima]|nr:MAG: hypothetical protein M4579_003341 [Chaenotheca gracillima]